MYDDVDDAITRFLSANRECRLIEAVIDTSVAKDGGGESFKIVPYLNLWAFNISKNGDLKSALGQVAITDDWGFLADIVQEQDSSTFDISLEAIYPHWPGDLENGNEKIVNYLMSTAKLLSAETLYIFHHIDCWPPIDLCTGKDIDIT
jgi:hypothetical protein